MGMNRDMMAQLAQMQERLMKAQAELAEKKAEGSAGGGAINVVITGGLKVESIKIDREVVDPDDVEMLEDLLTAALNEVLGKVQSLQMGQLAGLASSFGIGIPNLGQGR
jgi:DNA-binding YbaB/EbfC family protein